MLNEKNITHLRMIRFNPQRGHQQRLAALPLAPAFWFDGHKDGIHMSQGFGVIELRRPAFLRVVFIEESEINIFAAAAAFPCLEIYGSFQTCLPVKIVSVKDEGFVLGIEDASEGLALSSRLSNLVYLGDQLITGVAVSRGWHDSPTYSDNATTLIVLHQLDEL